MPHLERCVASDRQSKAVLHSKLDCILAISLGKRIRYADVITGCPKTSILRSCKSVVQLVHQVKLLGAKAETDDQTNGCAACNDAMEEAVC